MKPYTTVPMRTHTQEHARKGAHPDVTQTPPGAFLSVRVLCGRDGRFPNQTMPPPPACPSPLPHSFWKLQGLSLVAAPPAQSLAHETPLCASRDHPCCWGRTLRNPYTGSPAGPCPLLHLCSSFRNDLGSVTWKVLADSALFTTHFLFVSSISI